MTFRRNMRSTYAENVKWNGYGLFTWLRTKGLWYKTRSRVGGNAGLVPWPECCGQAPPLHPSYFMFPPDNGSLKSLQFWRNVHFCRKHISMLIICYINLSICFLILFLFPYITGPYKPVPYSGKLILIIYRNSRTIDNGKKK